MKQNETTAPDDARFVCTTILDEALIVRWNDFHFRHIQTRSRWVSMACGMIIMIIGAVMFIMNLDQSSIDLLISALIALSGALILFTAARTPKMSQKRMKARYAGDSRQYAFHAHYLEVRSAAETAQCPYTRIKAVYVLKEGWYLYTFPTAHISSPEKASPAAMPPASIPFCMRHSKTASTRCPDVRSDIFSFP